MALRNTAALVFFVTMAFCGACFGSIYRVGDSDGWSSRGLVDYNKWASTKDFHVNDTLVFAYNNQFHNVMQVSNLQDFESCNATSPIAAYTSGSDTISLNKQGHYYFICGAPGHCQAGQKIDINVTLPDSLLAGPSPAPYGSSPSSSHPEVISSSSTRSTRPSLYFSKLGLAVLFLLGFIF